MKGTSPGNRTQRWAGGPEEQPPPPAWPWAAPALPAGGGSGRGGGGGGRARRRRTGSSPRTPRLGPQGRVADGAMCFSDEREEALPFLAVLVSSLLCSDDLEEPSVPSVPVRFPWEPEWQRHLSAEVRCPQDAMNTQEKTIREE